MKVTDDTKKRRSINDVSGIRKAAGNGVARPRNIDKLKFGWMPNDLFTQGYARQLGPYCMAVYAYLAFRADNTTQECWPSIKTMATELGIGESKTVESVKELEAWGIILVESRYTPKRGGGKQWHSNSYTLLHPSSWRTVATFKNAKGKTIIKKLDFESESSGSKLVVEIRMVDDEFNIRSAGLSGIPGEPGDIPSRLDDPFGEPGVMRPGDQGDAPSGEELHSGNQIHLNGESGNEIQEMNECPPSLSLRDRALLLLLRFVAPNFRNPEKVVSGLPADRFDLVGAIALCYLANPDTLKRLKNPAAYFHYVMNEPREDENDIPGLPYDWDEFKFDWGRYLALYQRVYGGNSNSDVHRKYSCLLKRYGLSSPWTKEVMERYPCGHRDWDEDDDLDDDGDLDEEIPF